MRSTAATSPRAARPGLHRVGWGMADQMLSSLTNFALAFVVARTTPIEDFGAFALVMVAYQMVVHLARAVAGEIYISVDHDEPRTAGRAAVGLSMLLGLLGSLVCVVVAASISALRLPMLALAVCLPGLVVQDAWRFVFFGGGRTRQATVNDGIWAALQFLGLAVVLVGGTVTVPVVVLIWGVTGMIAAIVGSWQFRAVPAGIRTSLSYGRRHGPVAANYVVDLIAQLGSGHMILILFGTLFGLQAVGQVQAARLILGPLNLLQLGLLGFGVPEIARLRRADRIRTAGTFVHTTAAAMTIVDLAFAAFALAIPVTFGQALFGSAWSAALPVLIPVAIKTAAIGASSAYNMGMRGMGATKAVARVQTISSVGIIAAGLVGALLGGFLVGVWAVGVSTAASVLWWWSAARNSLREQAVAG